MADLILILVLALFALIGSRKGLVKTLFGVTSTLVSILLSMMLYKPVSLMIEGSFLGESIRNIVADYIANKFSQPVQMLMLEKSVETVTYAVTNALGFIATLIISKIIIYIVSNVLNFLTKLPVIKQANKLLGAMAGLVGGILVCYIALGIIASVNAGENMVILKESIENSYLAFMLYENNMIAEVLTGFLK